MIRLHLLDHALAIELGQRAVDVEIYQSRVLVSLILVDSCLEERRKDEQEKVWSTFFCEKSKKSKKEFEREEEEILD